MSWKDTWETDAPRGVIQTYAGGIRSVGSYTDTPDMGKLWLCEWEKLEGKLWVRDGLVRDFIENPTGQGIQIETAKKSVFWRGQAKKKR